MVKKRFDHRLIACVQRGKCVSGVEMPDLNPAENVTESRIVTSRKSRRKKSASKPAVAANAYVTDDRLVELFEDKMRQRIEMGSSKASEDATSTIAKICDYEEEMEIQLLGDELKNIKNRMANVILSFPSLFICYLPLIFWIY